MFYSDKEKEIMEKLVIAIDRNWYKEDERYTLKFADGSIVETKPFTCYDSDNGLDLDEEGYEEFFACAMKITKVITDSKNRFKDMKYIEITYHNYPQEVRNSKGEKL